MSWHVGDEQGSQCTKEEKWDWQKWGFSKKFFLKNSLDKSVGRLHLQLAHGDGLGIDDGDLHFVLAQQPQLAHVAQCTGQHAVSVTHTKERASKRGREK